MNAGSSRTLSETHAVTVVGGAGPPIVFLHGLATNQTIWHDVVDRLSGFTIVTYDQAGCGLAPIEADESWRYETLDGYADDLVAILESQNLSGCTVVGHSASGIIAILAASATSRISRLVTIGASPRYLNDAGYVGGFDRTDLDALTGLMERDYGAWVRTIGPAAMENSDRPELTRTLIYTFNSANPEAARRFARAAFYSDYRDRLATCHTPTLVLQSATDAFVPMEAARYLADHLPSATLVVLDARGHFPQLSAPGALAAAIREFLVDG